MRARSGRPPLRFVADPPQLFGYRKFPEMRVMHPEGGVQNHHLA